MRLIDTHTHLYLPEFEPDGGASAVRRAIDAGVDRMIFPNVDIAGAQAMMDLAAMFPDHVSTAMGLHPTEVGPQWRDDVGKAIEMMTQAPHVAVGEIGIDLYWDRTFRDEQMQALELQARKAVELDLPVIIHCREGLDETLEVLEGVEGVRGVMHSFGGSADDVERVRSRVGDFYFGINGIVTFKNSRLREVLPAIGLDRIVLETDAPYLAPVPMRGKRNESAYLIHTAAHVAHSLGLDMAEVAEATTRSARRLFGDI